MTEARRKRASQAALARLGAALGALLCLGLLAAASAAATGPLQQVGCFAGSSPGLTESCKTVEKEEFGEEVQLGGVGGMAVNVSGAGGVPPGTVYAASFTKSQGPRIAMFVPSGKELEFRLAWQVTSLEEPYERCGPALGVKEGKAEHPCAPRVKELPGNVDVDVNQETGDIYAYNGTHEAGRKAIVVYDPEGTAVISRFGEVASAGKSVAETPSQVHSSIYSGALAVNGEGEVYLFDENFLGAPYHRLMVFRPKAPGKFDEYEYAGEALAGEKGNLPSGPVADADGNIYVGAGTEVGGKIEEYAPPTPAPFPAPPQSPLCSFEFAPGGITAATVDPESGEPFFFSYKVPKRIHRLGPCDAGTGKFSETEAIAVAPERDDLWGLALDPTRELPGRGPGVLYGGAPSPVPSSAKGKGQPGQSSLGYVFAAPEHKPPAISAQSVSKVTATSAQLHATIDPQGHETHYAFQYTTEAAYVEAGETFAGAAEAPLGGATLEGTGAQAVGASLSGLTPDTEYRFRVLAESECGPSEACEEAGPAGAFRTYPPKAPSNRAYELVSPADKHGGQVYPADPRVRTCEGGECKPGGTRNHFPMQSAPDGEAVVYEGTPFGPGEGAAIENEYRAERTASGWQSANLTPPLLTGSFSQGYKAFDPDLTTGLLSQFGAALNEEAPPEYEDLYSLPASTPLTLKSLLREAPPGRPATGTGQFELHYAAASADLSRVFFEANAALTEEAAFAPAAVDGGAAKFNLYEWAPATGQLSLVNVKPGNAEAQPGAAFGAGSAHAVSDDGSRAFWVDESGQLYLRIAGAETVQVSESKRSAPDPLGSQPATFVGASSDGTRALFSSSEELTDDANTGLGQEVALNATAGTFTLTFAGQTTGATGTGTTAAGSKEVTSLVTSTGAFTVGEAISGLGIAPGTTIAATGAGALTLSAAATASATGVALTANLPFNASGPAVQGALQALPSIGKGNVSVSTGKEGSAVTFTGALATSQEAMSANGSGLTGSVSLLSFRPGKDLYEWHEGALTDLTSGQGSYAFQGLVGQGDGLSHVYFVDTAALTGEEENSEGDKAQAGQPNLYAWAEGAAAFVGTLVADDSQDWSASPSARAAQASPGGRYLAFLSQAPLTGYDNTGPCKIVSSGPPVVFGPGPCAEAYLFDSLTGELSCASCNPSEATPLGLTELRRIAGAQPYLAPPRYLTDSGRLYFDSRDSLSPSDTNEGVEDVYQFEPEGVGGCGRESGCVELVSAGSEGVDSNFLAVDGTGKNVFFTSRDRLVPADQDDLIDLYDAREGGGFPEQLPPLPCEGEGCQPPPPAAPESPPSSATFTGPGNVAQPSPKHCKKGQVKKNGKCAKKHKPKKGHKKRKRGGAK